MRDQRWNVDEISEKWAIYREKISQNSCWNLILPWKTILAIELKSGWIMTIGSSYSRCVGLTVVGSHPNCIWAIRCTTNPWSSDVIWVVRSARELTTVRIVQQGRHKFFFQKIGEKLQQSTIYCTFP